MHPKIEMLEAFFIEVKNYKAGSVHSLFGTLWSFGVMLPKAEWRNLIERRFELEK